MEGNLVLHRLGNNEAGDGEVAIFYFQSSRYEKYLLLSNGTGICSIFKDIEGQNGRSELVSTKHIDERDFPHLDLLVSVLEQEIIGQ